MSIKTIKLIAKIAKIVFIVSFWPLKILFKLMGLIIKCSAKLLVFIIKLMFKPARRRKNRKAKYLKRRK